MKSYYPQLQSIRGLAALSVALGHCATILTNGQIRSTAEIGWNSWSLAAMGLVFQPNTAVIVFYVLSGFVLGQSLRTSQLSRRSLAAFVLRRLVRLMPVVWLSVSLVAAYILVRSPAPRFPAATGWFNEFFQAKLSVWPYLENLLLLETHINPVLWSIQVEAVAALFMPFFVWLSARTNSIQDIAILAVMWLPNVFLPAESPWSLLYCFYLGVVIPKVLTMPGFRLICTTRAGISVIMAALIAVDVSWRFGWLSYDKKFVFDALASACLIAGAWVTSSRERSLLMWRPLTALGDISYSFYALHPLFMVMAGTVALELVPGDVLTHSGIASLATTLGIAAFSVVPALVFARLSYLCAEQPAILAGRRISNQLSAAA